LIEIHGNRFMRMLTLTGVMLLNCGLTFAQKSDSQSTATKATRQDVDSASDQYIDLLRKDIRSMKKQIIAANLDLTDGEAEKFWPIYEQYTVELSKINDTKVALIKDYAQNYSTMTDEQAQAYIKGRASVDESVNHLRVKYNPVFCRVLSGKTTATFFQIEWRVSLMIDLQLASQIPLIQQ
jgi:hypothetical protein